MTVPVSPRKAGPFNGNGVATSFPFDFKVFAAADLRVVHTNSGGVETDLTLDSDYSVTLNPDQEADPGGSVTYPLAGSPLPAGEKLTIVSNLNVEQPTDITNQGGFYPEVIEKALDRVTMLVGQQQEALNRAVKVNVSDTTDPAEVVATLVAAADTATTKAAEAAASADTATTKAAEAAASALSNDPANLVHIAGAEAISGQKTFSKSPKGLINSRPCVTGLRGNVNTGTPLTKFDLSADIVVLRDANGDTVTVYNTGTLTCDIGAAGIAANSWVYLYFQWNGATLTVQPSTVAPGVFAAANLQAGNTHWAFATAIRWNGSSNIIPVVVRGGTAQYAARQVLLNAGTATSETSVSTSSLIPSIALRAEVEARAFIEATGGGSALLVSEIRIASGSTTAVVEANAAAGSNTYNTEGMSVANVNNAIYYVNSSTGSVNVANLSIYVRSYTVSNGDG